jgi:DNA processing protein
VLEALGAETLDVDALLGRTGLSIGAVQAELAALELDGHVAAVPTGRWQRIYRQ